MAQVRAGGAWWEPLLLLLVPTLTNLGSLVSEIERHLPSWLLDVCLQPWPSGVMDSQKKKRLPGQLMKSLLSPGLRQQWCST